MSKNEDWNEGYKLEMRIVWHEISFLQKNLIITCGCLL